MNSLNNGGTMAKARRSRRTRTSATTYGVLGDWVGGRVLWKWNLARHQGPVHPKRVDAVNDPNTRTGTRFVLERWTKVVFTDEWVADWERGASE